MGILAWIVLGLIAGALAKAIMPGNDPGGFIVTILIGIVGLSLVPVAFEIWRARRAPRDERYDEDHEREAVTEAVRRDEA